MRSNQGLQADGGTAVVFGLVVQSPVGGSAAPAAERERCYDFQCQEW
jgi:hypothetical protein